jgi:hypothetical protein
VKFKRKQLEDKMGLDMYAYVASKAGQQHEFYETAEFNKNINEFVSKTVSKPVEIAYWRKHPSLHGWMEQLWERKLLADGGDPGEHTFNGIEIELTWEDVDELERTVKAGKLPFTEGFFFGKPSDNHYYEEDLKFCINAKAELFLGLKVFYNSSW